MSGKQNDGGGGAVRQSKPQKDAIDGIKKPSIRKLARRGGVKRIHGLVYKEIRDILKVFLENVIKKALLYMEYSGRKTVTSMDIVHALKQHGINLYAVQA